MKRPVALLVSACLIAFSSIAWAIEYENDDDDRSAHVPVVAHEIALIPSGQTIDHGTIQADLDYAASMKRHHEGAVTMSTDYLEDARGTNPMLRKMAQAIIANQRFEIAVLDEIRRRAAIGPEMVADLGFSRIVRRQTGIDGLEHQWKFVKRRPPGWLDLALAPGLESSERDVKFAKEMMLHHQMALDMARAYNADPDATNLILKRLNLDNRRSGQRDRLPPADRRPVPRGCRCGRDRSLDPRHGHADGPRRWRVHGRDGPRGRALIDRWGARTRGAIQLRSRSDGPRIA